MVGIAKSHKAAAISLVAEIVDPPKIVALASRFVGWRRRLRADVEVQALATFDVQRVRVWPGLGPRAFKRSVVVSEPVSHAERGSTGGQFPSLPCHC